ncbi:MAG: polyprenyl synthetase family protein, partial [Bryobacteraceae bacterium]
MIRPILVWLAADAAGGKAEEALPAAEAMELLHVAALIHDDIIDRADERRGLPALHRSIGESAALVVGDYLILRSFDVLARAVTNESSVRVLKAVRALSRFAQECCRGQLREIAPYPDGRFEELAQNGARRTLCASEQQYFSIVRGKTASQFAAAVTLGAVSGNASDGDLRALRTFGVNAGIAFQIRDDELDLIGDSAVLGKPAGTSMGAGRPMLPFIYLAKHGSPDALAAFAAM